MKISFNRIQTSLGVSIDIVQLIDIIQNAIVERFQSKNFGGGCKEINYQLYCVNTGIFEGYSDGSHFESSKRKIVCSIELDYKTLMQIVKHRQFLLYLKNRFLEKALEFDELCLEGFDAALFINELELFFDDFLAHYANQDQAIELE